MKIAMMLSRKKVPTISMTDFCALLEAGTQIDLLDVRTPTEITLGKITKHAIEINFHAADFQQQILQLPRHKHYVVYCASGGRSARAVQLMKANGYPNVQNLEGGYNAFTDQKPKH